MTCNSFKNISAEDLGRTDLPDFALAVSRPKGTAGKPSIFPEIFSTLDMVSKKAAH